MTAPTPYALALALARVQADPLDPRAREALAVILAALGLSGPALEATRAALELAR